jgi:general secretion pathway protein G
MKKSFTLLEIIFVISVLAILSSVAIPKFIDSLNSANILKVRSDISMIRSNIIQYKEDQLLKASIATYPTSIDNILDLLNIASQWSKNNNLYTIKLTSTSNVEFKYDSNTGIFDCTHKKQDICKEITQ